VVFSSPRRDLFAKNAFGVPDGAPTASPCSRQSTTLRPFRVRP